MPALSRQMSWGGSTTEASLAEGIQEREPWVVAAWAAASRAAVEAWVGAPFLAAEPFQVGEAFPAEAAYPVEEACQAEEPCPVAAPWAAVGSQERLAQDLEPQARERPALAAQDNLQPAEEPRVGVAPVGQEQRGQLLLRAALPA